MRDKIVLIDGHSILNRAFYGIPDLTNADGLHTNAIYGFLNILFKIVEEEKPEYLTVAFDVHAPTFRHKMFEAYKGTRKPMAEELRQQVPVMKEVLHAMGVQVVEQAGLEADDILGTISCRCEREGMDVVILSGDRDLLQLATEHVKIRIPKTKQGKTEIEDYFAKDVLETYQVTPKEFIDLKALMGDTSDNIPGVPSIGEKTATKIITEYHSIENAFEHVHELKPPRASKALQEHYDLAQMSKELATICVTAEIPFSMEQAKLQNLYTEEAYVYFQKLQFKNLLSRFQVTTPANDIESKFVEVTTCEEIERIFAEACGQKRLAFVYRAACDKVGMTFGNGMVYCFSFGEYFTNPQFREQFLRVSESVEELVTFHLKEQLSVCPIVQEEKAFDAIVAAYLLNPLKNDYAYDDIALEQLDLMIDEKLDEFRKTCYMAYVAYACVEPLTNQLEEKEMERLFREIEMPLVFTLYRMEQAGIRIESEDLKQYGQDLEQKIEALQTAIYEEAGEEFNLNSPKQLGLILFEKLQLPYGKKTKTGYSTAADVLEKLAAEYPIVSKILEYRQLAKLKSTYADGLANFISGDGRIHGKFHQTITATGRISSTEPNLQNIPVRLELGRLIRKAFIPEDGYVFVDADYSQIELRILAHCSGDEALIQAYREAQDIHRITASQVFHIPFDEVTPEERRNAKAVNFGIVYGISSFGLSQDLSISKKEAAQYIDSYFQTYPGIKRFLDDAVAHAKEKGYVVTLFGRRRPVPELESSNFMQRSFGERVAMNAPIQGTAADIMKLAMIGVDHAFKERNMKSRIVVQVHDELLIEAHQSELDEVKAIVTQEMEQAAHLNVPLEIDMHTGSTWYEAK